jgi:hypothetical protein
MSSNYPPGVSGNEPEIAGYPDCTTPGCGHPDEEHGNGDLAGGACTEPGCACGRYDQYPPDPPGLDTEAEA